MATYIIATYIIALNKVRPPKTNERLVSEPPPVSPKAGPAFPVPDAPRPDAPRPFVGDRDILAAIRNNLVSTPLTDRPFQHYFTLANLHNNRKVLDYDLRLSRTALAKLFNSLSWKPIIVVPQSIDPHETVYVVDLRDLGWKERNLWGEILRFEKADNTARFVQAHNETHRGYPYGLDYEKASDEEVRRLAGEVGGLTGCELCFVRADWFIRQRRGRLSMTRFSTCRGPHGSWNSGSPSTSRATSSTSIWRSRTSSPARSPPQPAGPPPRGSHRTTGRATTFGRTMGPPISSSSRSGRYSTATHSAPRIRARRGWDHLQPS